ncbi:MAG: hypothetical protein RSA44_05530, partial [Bacteroides sp.]
IEMKDSIHYNQITGKEMKPYFNNGEMYKVDVLGNVQLIFYPEEKDSTLLLMNYGETSVLNMYLRNRKMDKGVMSPKSNGVAYPLDQIPPDKIRLDNFAWFDYIRPMSKEDIFNWRAKKADQLLKKTTRKAAPLPNQNLLKKK